MLQKIKSLKKTYELYNFFQKKYLKHNTPLYKKYGLNKKYYSSISTKDFEGIKGELNEYDIKNSSELLKNDSIFLNLDKKIQDAIINWSDNGYAIIRNFFSEDQVNLINAEIDTLISTGELKPRYKAKKYMFANRYSNLINEISNGEIKNILELLLGRKISLFQTINFENGSQQGTHSDSVHMTTFPKGNLIAVWVALEDIDEGCGPLHYYPGSHKLPYIMNEDYGNQGDEFYLGNKSYNEYEEKIEELILENNLDKKVFLAKKGDILIWHANLLHGGNKVNNEGSTRKSMVFHYLADDVICYHETTQRPTLKGKFK